MVRDQQREIPERKSRRVEHRIAGLHQPNVRPIARGKTGGETEFGAKLTANFEIEQTCDIVRNMKSVYPALNKDSSETVIAITILTVNLIRREQEKARILWGSFDSSAEYL